MTARQKLVIALWLILAVYWGVTALGANRNAARRPLRTEIGLRLAMAALVVAALFFAPLRHAWTGAQAWEARSAVLGIIGVAFCALGVGLAVLGRAYLGRNWGMPMSRKENPTLVTSGPYSLVRHPIYFGLLLAMLGTTLAGTVLWLLPLILFGPYLVYSAKREERLMLELFPDRYPKYVERTKMLLPFLW